MLRVGIGIVLWAAFGMACESCGDGICQNDAECANDEVCVSGECRYISPSPADGGNLPDQDAGYSGPPMPSDAGEPDAGPDGGSSGGGPVPVPDAGSVDLCDRTERCSFEDEDCDGQLNNDLDCTFLASSGDALWRVDPFAQRVELEFEVDMPPGEQIFDIDQAPDGNVYATSGARKLYRIAAQGPVEVFAGTSSSNSPVPRNPNGLAIGDDGTVFISNHDALVGGRVVSTNSLDVPPALLKVLDPYNSSGDCVIDKGSLLVSAVNLEDDESVGITDLLIRVPFDGSDPVLLGSFGFLEVYGLSSSFDRLFAVTGDGKVVLVNRDTGASELLFESDISFTGAANRR